MGTVARRPSRRWHQDSTSGGWTTAPAQDAVAVEEPLEIRLVDGLGVTLPWAVVMRTPGHDVDLALGFCVGEGIVATGEEVLRCGLCTTGVVGVGRAADALVERQSGESAVEVVLAPGVPLPDPVAARRTVTSSACGVCGAATLEAVRARARWDVAADPVTVDVAVLAELPGRLRARQKGFDRTGGLHAAGLVDLGRPGVPLVCVREDVGRHNAVDKVVGWAVQGGRLPLRGHALQVSGRASFEIVQKAAVAGIPVVAAVSAPSSLAVDLARELGVTLAGFSRGDRLTVYAGAERMARGARA
ncbi:MAG: formate dehydrogenase accessory sulfurtransferase FdhD [Kineosporiaceae bacterium]